MDKEILDDKIVVYKNVIDGQKVINDIKDLVLKFNLNWDQGVINEGIVDTTVKDCGIINMHRNMEGSLSLREAKYRIARYLDKMTSEAFLDYVKSYDFNVQTKEGWEFMQYQESGKFEFHTDQSPFHRCEVSMVLYLNDNYEGGQMQFFNYLNGMPWKPVANSILIFPSTSEYRHRVLPVASGERYTVVNFAF